MLQFLQAALLEVWQEKLRQHDDTRARRLTKSPFRVFAVQVHSSSKFSGHLVETLDRILRATRCVQRFAHTLSNCHVEIIKFPSRYLSKPVSDLDALQYSH